jgi:hypothetical protein
MRIQSTAGGLAIACTLAVACAGGGASTGFGEAGADASRPTRDAARSSKDAAKPSHDAAASSPDAGKDAVTSADSSHSGDGKAKDAKADAHDGAGSGSGGHDGSAKDAHADADASGKATDASGADAADTGGGSTPTFSSGCDGGHTALTGTVYAPNGTDPIPNVRVYAASAINAYPASFCDKCSFPIDPAFASTTSAVDGTFTLDLDQVPASPTIEFTIQIGRFRKHTSVAVTACQSLAVSPSTAAVLPGNSAAGDIPKIVVSSGNVDHLDAVLTALGITEYDCYEGRKTAGTSTATCQQVAGKTIADVLETSADIGAYNMAFLSCAPGAYASFAAGHPQMTANTQAWVSGGGRLFVTDTAYDYVAQAFPAAVTWQGPSTTTPQPVDGANVGCAPAGADGGSAHAVEYPATIDDPSLGAWLTMQSLAKGSPPVASIQGYYEPWSAIASLASTTGLIVDGTMPIDPTYSSTNCKAPTPTDVPLTTEFDVSTCGRVVFSSFHTYTGSGASSAAANEKIMEYLIFAAAECDNG